MAIQEEKPPRDPRNKKTRAAEKPPAETHRPYVPDDARMPEFTLRAVVAGSLLGIVFGASSLYLVLKVGMTVSASIPVAVLSITLFRVLARVLGIRSATILENNIVQTAGSAGESIAFGVGVTMPVLMILGFEMDVGRVMVVSILGGLLGILMMIPLRRAFIVRQHATLKYPEGTACADVLIVGEQGGSSAKTVFAGFGVAFLFKFLMQGLRLWREIPAEPLRWFKGATAAMEADPALLGVGYIIGTRIACIMAAGGFMAWFVIAPAIHLFGDGLAGPLFPGKAPIAAMSDGDIRNAYVLYIGAGAVTTGGIISLFQALPLIFGSIRAGLRDIRASRRSAGDSTGAVRRTDRDIHLWVVGVGSLALVGAIWATSPLHERFPWVPLLLHANPLGAALGAALIVLFGFLFVTVSSRLTGEIGSSSNPISGMTVATLLLTCLIFLLLGWKGQMDELAALSVAAVVCIAASNGGTTSQDLKTGYLVGATPVWQQLAILIGTLTSALVIGTILILLNQASTVYTTHDLPQLKQPLDVAALRELDQAPNDSASYHVWRPTEGNPEGVPQGKYLVDDLGRIRYLVDPGINGSRDRRDDGTPVQKFSAPKAKMMALITDGILNQKLPWTLVLLGVSIALVLELSGVPSLPFAVGVYLPLSSSTPILLGGLIRYAADKWAHTGTGEARSEAESEMSPGILLSTGYIAGGAIGGVLIAFLSFNQKVPELLGRWQNREFVTARAESFRQAIADIADEELGVRGVASTPADADRFHDFAAEVGDLNADELAGKLRVAAGTVLKLPDGRNYTVPQNELLSDAAKGASTGGTEIAPRAEFELNSDHLELPAGTALKVPQNTWPALAAFGILASFLLAVGLGWMLRSD